MRSDNMRGHQSIITGQSVTYGFLECLYAYHIGYRGQRLILSYVISFSRTVRV